MRTLTYTDDKVEPGEKSTAKVTINGETGQMMKAVASFDASVRAKGGDDDEFPFFYLEAQDENTKLTNGGKFDTGGVFAGPKALKVNATLAEAAGEDCSLVLAKAKQGPPEPSRTAVATEQPFDANDSRKIIEAKVPIKPDPNAIGGVGYGLSMGSWLDDGDGNPEDPDSSDDEYECQPPYVSTLILKGALIP